MASQSFAEDRLQVLSRQVLLVMAAQIVHQTSKREGAIAFEYGRSRELLGGEARNQTHHAYPCSRLQRHGNVPVSQGGVSAKACLRPRSKFPEASITPLK